MSVDQNKLILTLMPKVMADIGSIEKKSKNSYQGYDYRSIEDTLAACQAVFIKNNITVVPSTHDNCLEGGNISFTMGITFYAPDGSCISASTFVAGPVQKGGFQASGAAYSYGFKEIIFKTFCVPVKQEDADRIKPVDSGSSVVKAVGRI